jgi:alpha-beta hydrolase superfamily lysophospholipase
VHGVVTARLVRFMQSAARDALDAASRVATPVLLLVAGDDALVDASGSRAFFERLNEKIRTMHWYDQSYHEVFNESAQQRAIVLNDLSLWLDSQLKR